MPKPPPTTPFYERYWQRADSAKPEHDPLTPFKASHLVDLLQSLPASAGHPRVVDAGCGAGSLALRYAAHADEVLALDVSANAIAVAKGRGAPANVRFVEADLEARWPVEDGWADLVVSSEVVEHLYEFPRYFAELGRVLRPGGRLYLTTPYHGILKNLALAVRGFDAHFANYEGGHIRFFTDAHLARLLAAVGFANVRFRHLGRIPVLAMSTALTATRR